MKRSSYFLIRYQKAIQIYEEVARYSLNNNLLKYGARGHLLNAGICQLCKGDIVAINNALDKYQASLFLIYNWEIFLHIGIAHLFSVF